MPCQITFFVHHERSVHHLACPPERHLPALWLEYSGCTSAFTNAIIYAVSRTLLHPISPAHLCILHHSNLGGAQHSAVELEALLLNKEDGVVLFTLLRRHKSRLVLIRVELFADGVEALEAVLLQCILEDAVGHLEALAKVGQILQVLRLFLGRQLRLGHHRQCPVQVVHAVDQVLGKVLNGELARVLDLALGAVLQVAEVGDCAKAFVLVCCVSACRKYKASLAWDQLCAATYLPFRGLFILCLQLLLQLGNDRILICCRLTF